MRRVTSVVRDGSMTIGYERSNDCRVRMNLLMGNASWRRFATATSHTQDRKQPCERPGNVCQNAQINLASTPDVAEVEMRPS